MTLHLIQVAPVPTGRAIIHATATRHGIAPEDIMGRSQAKHIVAARRKAVAEVHRVHPRMTYAQIGRLFHRSRNGIYQILGNERRREKIVTSGMEHDDYILEVEAQLRRICGMNICHQVAHSLEIHFFEGMMLSILMENYPRVMTYDQILEAYEAAHERIYADRTEPKSDSLIRTFCQNIRKHFRSAGLPNPVETISPRALILSPEGAEWLHGRFGKPTAMSSPIRLIA